jgi:hypothetical protein
MKDPVPGELCRHYKGGVYVILAVAIHTEDREMLVIYRSLENSQVWARPRTHFCQNVEVGGNLIQRFERILPIEWPSD